MRETVYGSRKRLEWILQSRGRDDRILEVGCGTGYMLCRPLARLGYRVNGIDLDAKSIEHGRSCSRRGPRSLDPGLWGPARATPRPTVVIASEVLEHLHDAELDALLAEIRDRLGSGGRLLVTVPNGYGWFELEQFSGGSSGRAAACSAPASATSSRRRRRATSGRRRSRPARPRRCRDRPTSSASRSPRSRAGCAEAGFEVRRRARLRRAFGAVQQPVLRRPRARARGQRPLGRSSRRAGRGLFREDPPGQVVAPPLRFDERVPTENRAERRVLLCAAALGVVNVLVALFALPYSPGLDDPALYTSIYSYQHYGQLSFPDDDIPFMYKHPPTKYWAVGLLVSAGLPLRLATAGLFLASYLLVLAAATACRFKFFQHLAVLFAVPAAVTLVSVHFVLAREPGAHGEAIGRLGPDDLVLTLWLSGLLWLEAARRGRHRLWYGVAGGVMHRAGLRHALVRHLRPWPPSWSTWPQRSVGKRSRAWPPQHPTSGSELRPCPPAVPGW